MVAGGHIAQPVLIAAAEAYVNAGAPYVGVGLPWPQNAGALWSAVQPPAIAAGFDRRPEKCQLLPTRPSHIPASNRMSASAHALNAFRPTRVFRPPQPYKVPCTDYLLECRGQGEFVDPREVPTLGNYLAANV